MVKGYSIGAIVSTAALLAVWWLISVSGMPFIPAPAETGREFVKMFASGTIWPDLAATMFRVFLGFLGAALIGVPVGLLMGYFSFVYGLLQFPIDFFRSLPATALFPLFMLFLGVGDLSKIALVVFSCSLIMAVHGAAGVRNAPEVRRLSARSMGAGELQVFTKVVFPNALPEIMTGCRIVISISMILAVVMEMFIGTRTGLGKMLFDAHLTYRIPRMYAVIFLVGLIGYALNRLFVVTRDRMVRWSGK